MFKTFLTLLMVMSLAFVNRPTAMTVEEGGTLFEDRITIQGIDLVLTGTAQLRHLIFIKAYTGAFYLPKDIPGKQALADVPKHLVLEYHVAISAEDFAYATKESIRSFLEAQAFEALEPKIDDLNRLYSDVKQGDRYALTYIPGTGSQLALNDQPLGTIQGSDFAFSLFSVWLGASPIDSSFRDKLLGGP